MDVECIAPLDVLRSVYPKIPIGYKPMNKHIELKNEDKLMLVLLVDKLLEH